MKTSEMRRIAALFIVVVIGVVFISACGKTPESANAAALNNAAEPDPAGGQLPFGGRGSEKSSHDRVTIPQGTVVTVRMQSGVSSATAQPGETFTATLDQPIVSGGRTIVKEGSTVFGKVVSAKRSGRLQDPGYIKLTLVSLAVEGKQMPIDTSSVSAKGASHKKRNLAMIGGGSGAGALIGALAGGGKGALIGAGVGAAAGTTGAYATGKKDVGFGPERRLSFRLTQPLVIG